MPKTVPFLWFDSQAEEAASFYVDIFPRSQIVNVSRYGPGTPGVEGSAMTVDFVLDGEPWVALNGGPQFSFTQAISFQIPCADADQVDHYWSRLTDGGEEGQCGWLKDRFGLSWQVVPAELGQLLGDPDPGRAHRAMQAMLGMRKLDVAELRRAADG
jgi:predicted 3-demethylubiquinone-9 3-methyltransferase (glyoxalase superfamily)